MLRVKLFSSAAFGGDMDKFEAEINGWLASAHPAIRQMTQSGSEGRVAVTFLYDSNQRDAEAPSMGSAAAFEGGADDADFDQADADDEPTLLPDAELPY
jgi:hypothetical protein